MVKKPFTPIPPMAELPPAEEINVREILDKYLAGEIDLICVLGPTASGKTRYAVRLARQINALIPNGAEIISADSRQVYRGMDIGTGKDLSEYEEIPYHLMDIVGAGEKYNIAIINARHENVYFQIRKNKQEESPDFMPISQLLNEKLGVDEKFTFVGDGVKEFENLLKNNDNFEILTDFYQTSLNIGKVALNKYIADEKNAILPHAVVPIYLRKAQPDRGV